MSDVALSEFLTGVLPAVEGCPRNTAIFELRNTAIDFCTRTHYDQRTVTGTLEAGDQILLLEAPEGFAVVAAASIRVDTALLLTPMTRFEMDRLMPGWENATANMPTHYVARSAAELQLWPAMDSAADNLGYSAELILKPARDGTLVAAALYQDCYDVIVAGALARLLRMPGKPWADIKQAGIYAEQYVRGMNEAKVRVCNQFSNANTFMNKPTFGVS